MALRWLHLRNVTYARADRLQTILAEQHLLYKSLPPALRAEAPVPPPYLLTFECQPTYTYGRREVRRLTAEEIDQLSCNGRAAVHAARRGGQVTWHGPGQLTAFLVLSLDRHGLRPATHVHMLEQLAIDQLADPDWSLRGFRDPARPGVWCGEPARKIAAVGVHLRRNVSLYGLGLNVCPDLAWFKRIEACGLPGSATTSMWELLFRDLDSGFTSRLMRGPGFIPRLYRLATSGICFFIGESMAQSLADRLRLESWQKITEEEILAIEQDLGLTRASQEMGH